MLGLPLPQIWKLHVKIGRKVQLAGLFLLGGFVCVVSIIRIPQVRSVSLTDPAWSDVSGSIWSIVETNIGLVSACLPTLRPLYSYLFHGRVNDSLAPTALTDSRNWRTKDAHGGNLKRYGLQPASSSHQPFAHLESGHDTEYSEPTTMIDDGNK
ncbi:hypothetical protein MMC14_000244 [Varicellaria rhodocarpa]|nr:hypothetical protein [Varicellaria rhodocarpa]